MIQAIVIVLLIVVAWYTGFQMGRREYEPSMVNWRATAQYWRDKVDALIDEMFDSEDMIRMGQAGYQAGTRRDESWTPEQWIEDTFVHVEKTEI